MISWKACQLSQLIDSRADAGDGACRTIEWSSNYSVDLLALSDHHDAKVYKTTCARDEMNCSGAIGIDLVGSSDGRPIHRGRGAIDNYVVDLTQIAFAVKMSHMDSAEWEGNAGSWKNQAFNGESVIAL